MPIIPTPPKELYQAEDFSEFCGLADAYFAQVDPLELAQKLLKLDRPADRWHPVAWWH